MELKHWAPVSSLPLRIFTVEEKKSAVRVDVRVKVRHISSDAGTKRETSSYWAEWIEIKLKEVICYCLLFYS